MRCPYCNVVSKAFIQHGKQGFLNEFDEHNAEFINGYPSVCRNQGKRYKPDNCIELDNHHFKYLVVR